MMDSCVLLCVKEGNGVSREGRSSKPAALFCQVKMKGRERKKKKNEKSERKGEPEKKKVRKCIQEF
jgi:hypothetical protein